MLLWGRSVINENGVFLEDGFCFGIKIAGNFMDLILMAAAGTA